jgi:hypothetical protein
MSNSWTVMPGGPVPYDSAMLYAEARHRVLHSRRLRPLLGVILADGYAGDDDHLRWVVSGRVGEIESWAKQIVADAEDER